MVTRAKCKFDFPIFVNENKIKLGIYNDETVYSDIFLKKYTELICLLCMEQYDLLDMYLKTGNHEVKECYLQMLKNYVSTHLRASIIILT